MTIAEHTVPAASISRIEAIPIALPLRREWRWRGLGGDLGRWVIVRVHLEGGGPVGLGEATPLPDWGGDHERHAGETPQTVVHVVHDLLAPALIGVDPFDIELAHTRMDAVLRGHAYAKAAVEMALYDVAGRLAGVPVHHLLGGRVRAGVRVAHMIGIMSRAEAVDEAGAAVEDGCSAFQIKGTGELERDVDVVRALRQALGDGVVLRLDANQGYRGLGVKEGLRQLRQLVEAGIDLLEQPGEGLREMAAFRAALPIPVIADESCWNPADAVDVIAAAAADALSIYVAKAGGLLRARTVATVAGLYGLPCDVNGSLESGVGNAASIHLATACPAISLPSVIPVTAPAGTGAARVTGRYYADDVVSEPFAFRDGVIIAPTGPGLGVELDEDKLEAFRVDRASP